MRRTVAALVAAILLAATAMAVSSCGGGGDAASTTPTATVGAAAAGAQAEQTVIDDKLSPTSTIMADEKSYPLPWPLRPTQTPSSVQERLDDHQPMMLVFIDSTQRVTKGQRVEIDAVLREYRGLIDLVQFDIVKGLKSSESTKSSKSDATKGAAMASDLGVTFTPYVVFVDRWGRITWRFAGFTDRNYLEREVLRATQ